ncbi:alpha/beta hydrolase [Bacillus pinisoli]|uniref:alpha/beta hydrolase n=1 Tax=Bacillus pinisoli TaxID=2901866 RepID=UPI001FF62170|nr:alpha/beta hydrolase [Bacillus pinisoli]
MRKLITAIIILLTYTISIGLFFSNRIMYIKKKEEKFILDRELKEQRFILSDYESLEKEEIIIPSSFGYDIKGTIIPSKKESRKFMIICHGVTMNRINSIKYMYLFHHRDFNVIMYDHRRHGESGGTTTSMGHYEKYDLQTVVHWTKEQFGNNITLGIHGESMGAVTTLLYAGMLEDGADFYIADCPFSDLEEQLTYLIRKDFKLPKQAVLPFGNTFLKWRDKYAIKDVSPISCVQNIQNPVLFIHSKDDDYILPTMSRQLYQKKNGPKKLVIAPKGSHAYSYGDNPELYEKVIDDFLHDFI